MQVRLVRESDWNAISRIQAEVYRDGVLEELEVLKSKHTVSPTSCFVCESPDGEVAGYLLSHPWDNPTPPKLFTPLAVANGKHQLFIHDMAVSAKAQGKGVGRLLMDQVIELTKINGMKKINLVAVQGADSYWSTLGFTPQAESEISPSYGDDAVIMEMIVKL